MMTEFEIISTVCLSEKSKNPIEIMCALMDLDFCNIHGCEHHTMVAAALLTAYFNTIRDTDSKVPMNLEEALRKLESVSELTIGGGCDYWKNCGAIDGAYKFWNVISESDSIPISFLMEIGNAVGSVGGPRCCKRSAYLAIIKATELVRKHLGGGDEASGYFGL